MTNRKIRESLLGFARAMRTHVIRGVEPRVNVIGSTMKSRLRYFARVNPLIIRGYKLREDPQEFLDSVYKVLSTMGVTSREKA